MKPLNHYIENEKEYAKCNICRVKLVNKNNICDVCGIRAKYNLFKEINGIRCFKHKTIEMIDVKRVLCTTCKKVRPTFNYNGEKTPKYCLNCKEPNMINIIDKKCEKCNKKQPSYNYEGERKKKYCADCKDPGMIPLFDNKCVKCNKKRPIFNYEGNINATCCGDCKEFGMIDIKNKKCEKCKKVIPIYNYEGHFVGRFCANCKEPHMVDVKHKKCEKCNIKQPSYNYPYEKIRKYCSDCKEPGMIDVINKKCEKCNKKYPIFNYQGETIGKFCGDCKDIIMINVTDIKCIKCKEKQPTFNYSTENKAQYCGSCKEPGMINVINKNCNELHCRKKASHSYPGMHLLYCSLHKKDGMMKNPRKKCIGLETDECKEIATHGINKPLHCEIHATDSEYNLAERVCSKCNRIDVLNKNGICVNFCSFEEKDRLMKKSVKKHEEFIGKLLKEEIDLTYMYQDEVVDSTCSKKRPDFVYHCGTHIVIIEVDENQHKSYKCTAYGDTKEGKMKGENIRMYEIAQSFDGLPVVFIRYNPDELKDVDQHKVKIPSSKRHLLLIKWIKTIFRMEWKQGIYVKYLFYDGFQESNIDFLSISEKDVLTF